MNNLRDLASNEEKQKTEYYWQVLKKAIIGPNRKEILEKIKKSPMCRGDDDDD